MVCNSYCAGGDVKHKYCYMKKSLLSLLMIVAATTLFGQGASVSPSRLYFNTAVGKAQTRVITVANNTNDKQSFQLIFGDFDPNGVKGKVTVKKASESKHSMADWLMANPAFIELEGNEKRDVEITLTVPNLPSANSVRWSTVQVKLVKEQTKPIDGSDETLGFGINETFQFVLYAFQTPPTITYKKVEILNYRKEYIDGKTSPNLFLMVKNTGDAIVDCAAFVELTNMNTGKIERLKVKAFTMLPDLEREVPFILPADLASGKYSAMGVVDFGSREEIEAAETTFDIP